jgi:hypothetical protein
VVSYPKLGTRVPGIELEGFETYYAETITADTTGVERDVFKMLNRHAQAGEIRTDQAVDVVFNEIGGAMNKRINAGETFTISRAWKFAIRKFKVTAVSSTATVRVFLV